MVSWVLPSTGSKVMKDVKAFGSPGWSPCRSTIRSGGVISCQVSQFG